MAVVFGFVWSIEGPDSRKGRKIREKIELTVAKRPRAEEEASLKLAKLAEEERKRLEEEEGNTGATIRVIITVTMALT